MPQMPNGHFVPPEAMGGGPSPTPAAAMPNVGQPQQASLDAAATAGPGQGGAATAQGAMAAMPQDAVQPQPAPMQPQPPGQQMGMEAPGMPVQQPMSMGWQPNQSGLLLYGSGQGPVSGQVSDQAQMTGNPMHPNNTPEGPIQAADAGEMDMMKLSRGVNGGLLEASDVPIYLGKRAIDALAQVNLARAAQQQNKNPRENGEAPEVPDENIPIPLKSGSALSDKQAYAVQQGYSETKPSGLLATPRWEDGHKFQGSQTKKVKRAALASAVAPALPEKPTPIPVHGDPINVQLQKKTKAGADSQQSGAGKEACSGRPGKKTKQKATKYSMMNRSAVGESGLVMKEQPWSLQGSDAWPSQDEMWSNAKRWDSSLPPGKKKPMKLASLLQDIAVARRQVQEPVSAAQADAGNYRKGHVSMHGLKIAIENGKGSTRSGTDPDGKSWSIKMNNDYGYIKRSSGADGDHVDVFVGDQPETELVFVVNQNDPKTAEFDEHKCMLGFTTEDDAKQAYLSNYEDGWSGLGSIKAMTLPDFKTWLSEGNMKKAADDRLCTFNDLKRYMPKEAYSFNDFLQSDYAGPVVGTLGMAAASQLAPLPNVPNVDEEENAKIKRNTRLAMLLGSPLAGAGIYGIEQLMKNSSLSETAQGFLDRCQEKGMNEFEFTHAVKEASALDPAIAKDLEPLIKEANWFTGLLGAGKNLIGGGMRRGMQAMGRGSGKNMMGKAPSSPGWKGKIQSAGQGFKGPNMAQKAMQSKNPMMQMGRTGAAWGAGGAGIGGTMDVIEGKNPLAQGSKARQFGTAGLVAGPMFRGGQMGVNKMRGKPTPNNPGIMSSQVPRTGTQMAGAAGAYSAADNLIDRTAPPDWAMRANEFTQQTGIDPNNLFTQGQDGSQVINPQAALQMFGSMMENPAQMQEFASYMQNLPPGMEQQLGQFIMSPENKPLLDKLSSAAIPPEIQQALAEAGMLQQDGTVNTEAVLPQIQQGAEMMKQLDAIKAAPQEQRLQMAVEFAKGQGIDVSQVEGLMGAQESPWGQLLSGFMDMGPMQQIALIGGALTALIGIGSMIGGSGGMGAGLLLGGLGLGGAAMFGDQIADYFGYGGQQDPNAQAAANSMGAGASAGMGGTAPGGSNAAPPPQQHVDPGEIGPAMPSSQQSMPLQMHQPMPQQREMLPAEELRQGYENRLKFMQDAPRNVGNWIQGQFQGSKN